MSIQNNFNNDNVIDVQEGDVQVLDMKKQEIIEYQENLKMQLRQDPKVESLTNQINVQDTSTILAFGKNSADEISKISDNILNSMKMTKVDDTGKLMGQLSKVLDKFDIKDLQETKEPGFFEKMFNSAKSSVDKMLMKYETMGGEVEKIAQVLRGYESEMTHANKTLDAMARANMDYFDELEKYICAGEMAIEELDIQILPQYKAKADMGDQREAMNYQQLLQVREMIEQRVYDLRLAENVALQSIPLINAMKIGNNNLIRNINSAFIITLPIFKQALAQALIVKRQELQNKSLQAFKEKSQELMINNAQNIMKTTNETTRLAGGGFIDVKTIQTTWTTIMNGIEENYRIQEQNKQDRINGVQALEQVKIQAKTNPKLLK